MKNIEVLHCLTCDTDFERERARGIKPKMCPACKAKSAVSRALIDSETENRVESIGARFAKYRTPEVQAILDGPPTPMQGKLAYVVNRLETGRNYYTHEALSANDISFTQNTYRDLLRQINRKVTV